MAEFQNTNLKLLVGSATTAAGETTLSTFKTSGSNGEVIATESDGTATASGSDRIVVASKKSDGTIDRSEVIPVESIVRTRVEAYTAATNQIDYVGYNGTSGEIDEIASNLYQLIFEIKNFGSVSPENLYRKTAHYKSSAVSSTQSQEAVAEGLVKSIIWNFSREPEANRIKAEMVNSDGGTALGTGTATSATIVLENGSKYVTGWADVDDATTNSALAEGNYLRVGTDTTDPIYKIESIDTSNDIVELSWPYQGETQTVDDTALEQITAAEVAAADCGVKLSAPDARFVLGKDNFEVMNFTTQVDFGEDATESEVTNDQSPSLGSGEGKRIAQLEWNVQGNFGDIYRIGEPHLYETDHQASSTGKYDVLTIDYNPGTKLFQDVTMPRTVMVACSAGSAGTDHTNINKVIDLLNNVTGNAKLSALSSL